MYPRFHETHCPTESAGAGGGRRSRRVDGGDHARPRGHRDAGDRAAHGPSRLPRATGVSTASMELLRSWGLEERALAGGDRRRVAGARDADAGRRGLGHAGRGRLPDPRAERGGQPDRPGVRPAGRARADDGGAPRLAARGADRARRRGRRRRQPRRRRQGRRARRAAASARCAPATSSPPTAPAARSAPRSASPRDGPGQVGTSLGILFRAPLWEVVGEHRHGIYFVGDDGRKARAPGRAARPLDVRLCGDPTPQDVTAELIRP